MSPNPLPDFPFQSISATRRPMVEVTYEGLLNGPTAPRLQLTSGPDSFARLTIELDRRYGAAPPPVSDRVQLAAVELIEAVEEFRRTLTARPTTSQPAEGPKS